MRATPVLERIERHYIPEPNSGCWLWTSSVTSKGYARIHFAGKGREAHRVVYQAIKGAIPKGLELDHLCRVRCCVNPDHLEPVAHSVNCARSDTSKQGEWNRVKTHCPQGHAYDAANTFTSKKGQRMCRICMRARKNKWQAKNRMAQIQYCREWRARNKNRSEP